MRVFILFVSFLIMVAPSCKKYEPAPEAFFLKPSSIRVAPESGQGSGSHNISDLWVYLNGQFQGAYPAGSSIPVVSKGENASLNIFAGIKNNGISTTRIPSLFYEILQIDTLLPGAQSLTSPLTFKYSSSVTFAWIEDFDGGTGFEVRKSDYSDTTFSVAKPEDSFEGRSLELGLKAPHFVAELESAGEGFALPSNKSNVYLELDYKCNHVFSVGLIGDDKRLRPVLNINPQQEWNKIYIQLAQAVNSPQISSRYKVYFRMERGESEDNLRMFLDNIKLVYL